MTGVQKRKGSATRKNKINASRIAGIRLNPCYTSSLHNRAARQLGPWYTGGFMIHAEHMSSVVAIQRIEAVPMILSMVKNLTGMRFSAVARVTDKKWIACAVDDSIDFGLMPGGELVLDSTICHEIRQHRKPVIFGRASAHTIWSQHHTPRTYGLESYVSIPIITSNGEFFGTLCAIDSIPADLDDPAITQTLSSFAKLIAASLDVQRLLEESKLELTHAQTDKKLHEQFVAVLGHDLRVPLSAIRMSADLLQSKTSDVSLLRLISAIRTSSVKMGMLIENVLDMSRGRLGGGIPVRRTLVDDLKYTLEMTLDEIKLSHPSANLVTSLDIPAGVYCDVLRINQMLSNLVVNAISHGSLSAPITVVAFSEGPEIVISVANLGPPISEALIPLLFHPFTRSEIAARGEGLGLGLYIASEIAAAHSGRLSVVSNVETGTCFVARFPAQLEVGEHISAHL
ncbi:GAF domain-containing sensor histidine kinase [Pseudomonas sp. MWU13-2517]|uniref:GAF domain-containing sensor histidine kinase n=1 Tax=Pseudomonas sp. MWU13-2517 TaxID=2929055 RepID=UPI00200E2AEC